MKFGPFEFYWNRGGAVIPAYVDFVGQDGGARGAAPAIDTAPLKLALGDLKDDVGTVIENQNGLDETMRRVGAATDRNTGGVATALEMLRLIQPDAASALSEVLSLRTLVDERTNQILSCMEDTALALQTAPIHAPVSTNPELTAQNMSDIGAKEEDRSPNGRRIWSIGRVRVYECRVGGGEQEVRGAIKEIIALRGQRPGFDSSVDLLAVAISDLSFPSAQDKGFINEAVLNRISFVGPEYLPTFVRLCLKKQQTQGAQQTTGSATHQTAPSTPPSPNLSTIRSKVARAHGQLQSGNSKNALEILASVIKLLGVDESTAQATSTNSDARADQKAAPTSEPTPQSDTNTDRQAAAPQPHPAGSDTSSGAQASTKQRGQGNKEKRRERQSAAKDHPTNATPSGDNVALQLPLEGTAAPASTPPASQTPNEGVPALLAAAAHQPDLIEGETRA